MDGSDFTLSKARIAIIGLGLMGGSLALALRGKCAALYGIDTNSAVLELALSQQIVDAASTDASALLSEADAIILSAPVPAILTLLECLPSLTQNSCIVMDLGSTKRQVVEAMSKLPANFDLIGGHPICGKEKLSLANAERGLYYAAPFLLTPLQRTSPRALSAARQIIKAIGAKEKILDALEHDRILAATSHLPFLISSALVLSTPEEAAAFIGPGFKSASRLAGTDSSMMLGVLQSNRENALNALHSMQTELSQIEAALCENDFEKLELLLDAAQDKYQKLVQP